MPVPRESASPAPTTIDTSLAFLMPGQGGQAVKLGYPLLERSPKAALVGQMADDIFGGEFVDVYLNGPEDKVNRTQWTQYIVAKDTLMRMAALEDLTSDQRPEDTEDWFTPGGSTREKFHDGLSAGLITAGVGIWYGPEQALQFIKIRGDVIGRFFQQTDARMFAMMDVDESVRSEMLGNFDVRLCLDNTDSQQVFGGENKNVSAAVGWLRDEKGLTDLDLTELPIGGVFHHPILAPVVTELSPVIDKIKLYDEPLDGKILMSNSAGIPIESAVDFRDELKRHNLVPVQHRLSMHYLVGQGVVTMAVMDSSRRLAAMNQDMFEGNSRGRVNLPKLSPEDKPPVLVQTWRAD